MMPELCTLCVHLAIKGSAMNRLMHSTYFVLSDHSAKPLKRFIEACKKYLSHHPGQVSFLVGPRDTEIARDVSDLKFDVAMTIVFKSAKYYDDYQNDPRHSQFIHETAGLSKSRRVFDSHVV